MLCPWAADRSRAPHRRRAEAATPGATARHPLSHARALAAEATTGAVYCYHRGELARSKLHDPDLAAMADRLLELSTGRFDGVSACGHVRFEIIGDGTLELFTRRDRGETRLSGPQEAAGRRQLSQATRRPWARCCWSLEPAAAPYGASRRLAGIGCPLTLLSTFARQAQHHIGPGAVSTARSCRSSSQAEHRIGRELRAAPKAKGGSRRCI